MIWATSAWTGVETPDSKRDPMTTSIMKIIRLRVMSLIYSPPGNRGSKTAKTAKSMSAPNTNGMSRMRGTRPMVAVILVLALTVTPGVCNANSSTSTMTHGSAEVGIFTFNATFAPEVTTILLSTKSPATLVEPPPPTVPISDLCVVPLPAVSGRFGPFADAAPTTQLPVVEVTNEAVAAWLFPVFAVPIVPGCNTVPLYSSSVITNVVGAA